MVPPRIISEAYRRHSQHAWSGRHSLWRTELGEWLHNQKKRVLKKGLFSKSVLSLFCISGVVHSWLLVFHCVSLACFPWFNQIRFLDLKYWISWPPNTWVARYCMSAILLAWSVSPLCNSCGPCCLHVLMSSDFLMLEIFDKNAVCHLRSNQVKRTDRQQRWNSWDWPDQPGPWKICSCWGVITLRGITDFVWYEDPVITGVIKKWRSGVWSSKQKSRWVSVPFTSISSCLEG